METSGRERRHRYYTVSAYRTLVAKENLDNTKAGYADIDLTNVGGFMPLDAQMFYENEEDLFNYEDSFKDDDKTKMRTKNARRKGPKNPVLPDGSVKIGRPRKQPFDEFGNVVPSGTKRTRTKRKRDEEVTEEADVSTEPPDAAGPSNPPRKKRRVEPTAVSIEDDEGDLYFLAQYEIYLTLI